MDLIQVTKRKNATLYCLIHLEAKLVMEDLNPKVLGELKSSIDKISTDLIYVENDIFCYFAKKLKTKQEAQTGINFFY